MSGHGIRGGASHGRLGWAARDLRSAAGDGDSSRGVHGGLADSLVGGIDLNGRRGLRDGSVCRTDQGSSESE